MKKFKKIACGVLSSFLFVFFCLNNLASAVFLDTANFRFNFFTGNSSYDWSEFLAYGSLTHDYIEIGYGSVRELRIGFANMNFDGNSASIHFETNVVKGCPANISCGGSWVNLEYMDIPIVAITGVGNLTILSKTLSYAVTPWTKWENNVEYQMSTLTFYGDVTVTGLPQGGSGSLALIVGSEDYDFFNNQSQAYSTRVYVEQNPARIDFSTAINDALQQTQINQNNTIINQNQQIIENNTQNTENIINNQNSNTQSVINNQNQNTQDIIKSNQRCLENLSPIATIDLTSSRQVYLTGLDLSAGTYTLSYDLSEFSLGTVNRLNLNFQLRNSNNATFTDVVMLSIDSGTQLGRKSFTFNITDNMVGSYSSIRISQTQWNNGGRAKLTKVMLESGSSSSPYIEYGSEECKNWNEVEADKDQADRDNLQNQQGDSSATSSSSQSQAQSTGTTLLTAFTSFVTAITSASPSNCRIDMDMGNLDLGIVDLCTLSLPTPLQTLASIFMIAFCVPLSIATARKLIALFRSFQG